MYVKGQFGIFLTLFPGLLGRNLPTEPEKGFQFNCWEDLCTFPVQYCDTFQKRCQYCSVDFCTAGKKIPEQCRSYCNNSISTTRGPTTMSCTTANVRDTTVGPLSNAPQYDNNVVHWLIFGTLVALFVLVAFFFGCYICDKKRRKRDHGSTKRGKQVTNPTNEGVGDTMPLLPKTKDAQDAHETSIMTSFTAQGCPKLRGVQDTINGQKGKSENLGDHEILGSKTDSRSSLPSTVSSESPTQPSREGELGYSEKMADFQILPNDGHTSEESSDSGFRDSNSQDRRQRLVDLGQRSSEIVKQMISPCQPEETEIKFAICGQENITS